MRISSFIFIQPKIGACLSSLYFVIRTLPFVSSIARWLLARFLFGASIFKSTPFASAPRFRSTPIYWFASQVLVPGEGRSVHDFTCRFLL